MGLTASIGFAIGALHIPHIVICWHTKCGVIKGAMNRAGLTNLQRIKTHPTVAVALARKAVKLYGWVYDLKSGEVLAYNDVTESWVPVDERRLSGIV